MLFDSLYGEHIEDQHEGIDHCLFFCFLSVSVVVILQNQEMAVI